MTHKDNKESLQTKTDGTQIILFGPFLHKLQVRQCLCYEIVLGLAHRRKTKICSLFKNWPLNSNVILSSYHHGPYVLFNIVMDESQTVIGSFNLSQSDLPEQMPDHLSADGWIYSELCLS